MSTHAFIGKRTQSGVRGIYLHYDGYVECAGRLLVQHHNSAMECDGLIENGQIRSLKEDGSVDRFYDGDYEDYSDIKEALMNGFSYAYIFEENDELGIYGWQAFKLDRHADAVIVLEIPSEETC